MAAEVKIVMHAHGRGEVFVDGQKMSGVRAVRFSSEVDQTNRVTLELIAERVEIGGVADVTHIGSEAREFAIGKEDGA